MEEKYIMQINGAERAVFLRYEFADKLPYLKTQINLKDRLEEIDDVLFSEKIKSMKLSPLGVIKPVRTPDKSIEVELGFVDYRFQDENKGQEFPIPSWLRINETNKYIEFQPALFKVPEKTGPRNITLEEIVEYTEVVLNELVKYLE